MDSINQPPINTAIGSEIPEEVLNEFKVFLKQVPANRLSKGLRKLLIDYLFYNIEALPTDFKDLLTDLYWLHELLDGIQGKEIELN
ncbi:hypothetical protein [Pedobacter sp. Hv1]|uniref:hypothetical protein n=1 Tax=Pedobacter sp. Hv1 TaxID=1740090 RepID=UPI0006D88F02|nr:hypothetical protein [Pedobacter sp. Hv1]KQB99477.1 hypothetical protein AQF98_18100 [Pedobacter sp. Hv1]